MRRVGDILLGWSPLSASLANILSRLLSSVTVYKAIKASGIRVGQWIALPGAGGVSYCHPFCLRIATI